MQPDWTQAYLRIKQVSKANGAILGTALINVNLIDNLGVFYNADT